MGLTKLRAFRQGWAQNPDAEVHHYSRHQLGLARPACGDRALAERAGDLHEPGASPRCALCEDAMTAMQARPVEEANGPKRRRLAQA